MFLFYLCFICKYPAILDFRDFLQEFLVNFLKYSFISQLYIYSRRWEVVLIFWDSRILFTIWECDPAGWRILVRTFGLYFYACSTMHICIAFIKLGVSSGSPGFPIFFTYVHINLLFCRYWNWIIESLFAFARASPDSLFIQLCLRFLRIFRRL